MTESRDYPLRFVIDGVISETKTVKTFVLKQPKSCFEIDLSRYNTFFETLAPGGFVMLWLPEAKGEGDDHAASDSIPLGVSGIFREERSFSVTVQKVGPTTGQLFRHGKGDAVGITGQKGRLFTLPDPAGKEAAHGAASKSRVLLVAGGVGIAPLRALYQHLFAEGFGTADLKLLYGVRTKKELIFAAEIKGSFGTLPPEPGAILFSDDGSLGIHGFPTERLTETFRDFFPSHVYFCGPEPMLKAAYKTIEDSVKTDESIIWPQVIEYSLETRFYCGVGICGLCSCEKDLKGRLVCRDGPIFSHEELSFWKK